MKRLFALILSLLLVALVTGCSGLIPNKAQPDTESSEDIDWDFYNGRAEEFIVSMANGDFAASIDMFDTTMKRALPAKVLESEVWVPIVEKIGDFQAIYSIENEFVDGYYICFTTSRHEDRGATLRVVFSKNGLVSGLFIDDYPVISAEPEQRNGYTDIPVVVGESTKYPLSGILSMPDGADGKVPAVVLVHGSGPQDMDETVYSNKPFRDIAEYLASNGVAVMRYDKRTFSYGAELVEEFGGSLTVREETVEDAILAIGLLKANPLVDENRVFILGHSLGGMLAARIHAEGGDTAGIISLAGSPRSLLDISYDQQALYAEAMPDGADKTLALSQLDAYGEQVAEMMKLSDEDAKNEIMPGGISFYYYKDMDTHPVSSYLESVRVPFLVMQGGSDFQVFADKDYVLWQELLAGRENATFKLYDGLNHLFMPSEGGGIMDYQEEYAVRSAVDDRVLQDIAEWIHAN